MAHGAEGWSFTEEAFASLSASLRRYLEESGSRCALLVDRSGQLITTVGEAPDFDPTAFASLTAADYSANDQLARLIGETEFTSLFHQGERESMYVAGIGSRLILVSLFDKRTTLGMVRLRTKQQVQELNGIIERLLVDHGRRASTSPGILAGADDEIDQLFR
jgi:predicted regulator of Ras-like GTPase activity (Roadblock/LC7/MglB family)